MIRRLLLLVLLGLASTVSAQTTTTRTDRLIASTSVTIGGTTFTTTAGTLGGTLAVTGASTLNGAVTLGDAAGDAISFSGRVSTSILWTTDNAVDLGASGANRPRDFFLARNAAIGGTLGVTGASTLAALSATTGSFSSTLGVTGASTLAALSATTGTFSGDVAVNGNDLTSTGVLTIRPTGNLTLDPTGDLILAPDGNDILPDTAYSKNLGAYTNKYLTVHAAELWIDTLVAQQKIATIGGSIVVSPTTTLTRSVTAGDTVIYVKHNAFLLQVGGVEYGSKLILQSQGKFEVMLVENLTVPSAEPAGDYAYTVQRNLDGTGANTWEAGDAVVDTGQTGSGFIDIYSTRGLRAATEVGPTLVGNVRLSGTWNDWAPRWALGNLNGLYGYSADTYGAAFGNYATANVTIDATNGYRVRYGATDKVVVDISGNASFLGSVVSGGTTATCGVSAGACVKIDTTPSLKWYDSSNSLLGALSGSGVVIQPFTSYADTRAYAFDAGAGGQQFGLYGLSVSTTQGAGIVVKPSATNWNGYAEVTALARYGVGTPPKSSIRLSGNYDLSGVIEVETPDSFKVWVGNYGSGNPILSILPASVALDTSTLFVDAANNRVGINDATPSYVLDITAPSTGAKLFQATCSGCGSLFGYADSGGSGITNADPFTGGAMVYLTGTTMSFYANNVSSMQITSTGVNFVGALTADGATGVSATFNPTGCTSMTFTDGLLTAKAGC